MRFAVVQLDIAWEDKPANQARFEAMLDQADVPAGAFVVLPELGDTGFSFALDRIVDDRSLAWARRTAAVRGVWLQVGYAERGADGRGRNCATIVRPDGTVAGTYRKVHPFSYGREAEHYAGGDELLCERCGPVVVCPLICYDLRFPELWRHGAMAGAEVFTIGASWPAARQSHWRTLLIARAIENQAYVVAVNRTGRDPQLAYAGGSIVIDPTGEVLAEAADEETVLQTDVDPAAISAWRNEFPALADMRPGLLGRVPIRGNASP